MVILASPGPERAPPAQKKHVAGIPDLAARKNHVAGIQGRPCEKNHVAGIPRRPREKIMSRESWAANAKRIMSRHWPLAAYAECRDMIFIWAKFKADFYLALGRMPRSRV